MTTLDRILNHKIVAIIRGAQPDDVLHIVQALSEGGVNLVEVTLNSPDALLAITKVSDRLSAQVCVGAGTVLDAEMTKAAINAGAQFIISPSLDIETIQATKQAGVVSIPGAFSATEIFTAFKNGGDVIKVFPASVGPTYFKDLRGPFPQIPLMPTGGVNLTNIIEFQQAGAVAFGIGSALVDTSVKISDAYLKELTEKAKQYVHSITHSEHAKGY
jgi:2-dehydro-3-deoxyphosphogluconate aldolase/(4S)-4-hydroxy-2-oxoglutarate aldolase